MFTVCFFFFLSCRGKKRSLIYFVYKVFSHLGDRKETKVDAAIEDAVGSISCYVRGMGAPELAEDSVSWRGRGPCLTARGPDQAGERRTRPHPLSSPCNKSLPIPCRTAAAQLHRIKILQLPSQLHKPNRIPKLSYFLR